MTSDSSRPNFFIILGLDPSSPWDPKAFVSAFEAKVREWSKQQSGIKTHPITVAAKRNLSLYREINKVMRLDDSARRDEQTRAIELLTAEQREQAEQLAKRVELQLAKGFLYDVEYEALKDELPTASAALRKRVERAEKRPVTQPKQAIDRLDPAEERNLLQYLGIVKHPDLYAVLRMADPAISSESSHANLVAAGDKLYRQTRNMGSKEGPDVGALQNLAGMARDIFSSAELASQYQASMRLAQLTPILERFERDLAVVRAVAAPQVELFLREAAVRGLDVTTAMETFIGYFRDRKWTVEVPGATAAATLRSLVPCPNCMELNDGSLAHCESCGTALSGDCPRCHVRVPAEAHACGHCGFRVGDRSYAEYLAAEAETFLARDDALSAADYLGQAERAWPLGAASTDPLAVRLRDVRAQFEPVRDRQRKAIEQLSELLESRNYRTAQRRLRQLPFSTPATSQLMRECVRAIADADAKIREAAMPGLPDERRTTLYLEALAICADSIKAERELDRLPPSPPRGLRAQPDEKHRVVRLNWQEAPDEGCHSVVVRTDGPLSPGSPHGQPRRTVPTPGTWEDPAPLVGQPMWYAVYTVRDGSGTLSKMAATTSEPVLLAVEPQLTARPGDNEVELTWTVPEHARVEIQREDVSAGSLVRLPPPADGATRRIDSEVVNGQRYQYVARAVYQYEVPGRPAAVRHSNPVTRDVIPMAPPTPPGPLRVRGYATQFGLALQRVEFGWPPTDLGEVRVLRSRPGQPVPETGAEILAEELSRRYGELVSGSEYAWLSSHERACYFTPVLLLPGGRCYPGRPRPYAVEPEVEGLRVEQAGASVRVTWNWPTDVEAALVTWDNECEVEDVVAAVRRRVVRRAAGAAGGACEITIGGREDVVRVAAVVAAAGGEFFTTGLAASVRSEVISLRYSVQRAGRRGSKVRLVLEPDRAASLPALVLVGRTDERPASIGDHEVAQVPTRVVSPGTVIEVPADKGIQLASSRLSWLIREPWISSGSATRRERSRVGSVRSSRTRTGPCGSRWYSPRLGRRRSGSWPR